MVDGLNGLGQTNAWFENNSCYNLQIIIGNMKIGRTYTLRLIAQDSFGKKYSDEIKVSVDQTIPPPPEVFVKVDKEAVAIYNYATLENLKSIKKSTGETINPAETWYMIVQFFIQLVLVKEPLFLKVFFFLFSQSSPNCV